MKQKTKVFSFLLAVVIFISSTGQVVSMHFCKMKQSDCKKAASCCCEKSAELEDGFSIASPDNCCFNSLNYIINPFSVRLPDNQLSKINIIVATVSLFRPSFNYYEQTIVLKHLFSDDIAPPAGVDLLTMISTFQI